MIFVFHVVRSGVTLVNSIGKQLPHGVADTPMAAIVDVEDVDRMTSLLFFRHLVLIFAVDIVDHIGSQLESRPPGGFVLRPLIATDRGWARARDFRLVDCLVVAHELVRCESHLATK